MKKFIARSLIVIAIILLIAIASLYSSDTDAETMVAKYGGDQAKFIDDGHGGRLHYRDQGNKQGPALLLIHGSNSHLQTWEQVVAELADKYRLITYDQPGHGLSGPAGLGDYRGDAMAAAGIKVLDAVRVDSAVWIGNSMGGWVSWRAALAYPDRVSSLVLIDASGAQGGKKNKPYIGARLMQTALGQAILPYVSPRFLVKSSLEQSVYGPDSLSEDVITRYWELVRFPGNRKATINRINADRQVEKWDDVSSITVPTLILWGEEDGVIPVSHADLFARAITGSQKIIYPQIGHLPMEENPKQISKDIDTFLSVNAEKTVFSE